MANTGPPAARPQPVKQETMGPMGNDMDPKTSLPTFIYDYFLKKGKLDLASALLKSDLQVNTRPRTKRSPDGREINGGDSAMDSDPKLDSIPEANIAEQLPNESFLQDWWFVFWDIWSAGKNKNASDAASRFLNQVSRNQMSGRNSIPCSDIIAAQSANEAAAAAASATAEYDDARRAWRLCRHEEQQQYA